MSSFDFFLYELCNFSFFVFHLLCLYFPLNYVLIKCRVSFYVKVYKNIIAVEQ
jgi:hypothetical protein